MSYQLLKGKKGIIFGALDEKSLAWRTALRCYEEGAQLVLTNAPVALRMGEINKLAEAGKGPGNRRGRYKIGRPEKII